MMLPLAEHVHPEWVDFGLLEWSIVGAAGLLVVWSIYKSVRYALEPGEEDPDHVKCLIFRPLGGRDGEVSSSSDETHARSRER